MSLRFHEIAEGDHRILNPFSEEKLDLLGDVCGLVPGARQLDLACGKGEMLCRWSQRHGIVGEGVDISRVFLEAAKTRAHELEVEGSVTFLEAEAGHHLESCEGTFDVVSCIGASWIGGGLEGTLAILKSVRREASSLLLVGEPFWHEPPPEAAVRAVVGEDDPFTSLGGTLERFERAGLAVEEMVVADLDDWDRYEAPQWRTVAEWLRAHPDDPDAEALASWSDRNRRAYLQYGRRYLGWGVFVLREARASA